MNITRFAGETPVASKASPVGTPEPLTPATMPQPGTDSLKFGAIPHLSAEVTTALGAVGTAGATGLLWLEKFASGNPTLRNIYNQLQQLLPKVKPVLAQTAATAEKQAAKA
jgi:hypothetical protein